MGQPLDHHSQLDCDVEPTRCNAEPVEDNAVQQSASAAVSRRAKRDEEVEWSAIRVVGREQVCDSLEIANRD